MRLIAEATRFFAYGQPGLESAWALSELTVELFTATTAPRTSGRAASVASFVDRLCGKVIRLGSMRMSVLRFAAEAVGELAWSTTPEQRFPSRLTSSVNGESASKDPFLPWT